MAKVKTYNVYTGGEFFETIKLGNENFNVASFNDVITRANEALVNISSMSVSQNGDNLIITFTPITDTKILNAVDNGDIFIRAQLLVHAGSLRHKLSKGASENARKRGYRYPNLEPITRTPDEDKAVWGEPSFDATMKQHWKRVKSHNPASYGQTWLNLTKVQLQAGSATLTNIVRAVGPGGSNYDYASNDRYFIYNGHHCYEYAALLYIPALGPGTSHPFQYHDNGYYKVSNNQIVVNQNNIS